MDILNSIKKNVDPSRYNLPDFVWNSLILTSRIRFHSFFRHALQLETEEGLALHEYAPQKQSFRNYISLIIKYTRLGWRFRESKKRIIKDLRLKEITILKTFCYRSSFVAERFIDPFFLSFTEELSKKDDYLIIVDPLMKTDEFHLLSSINDLNIVPWFSFLSIVDFFKAIFVQFKYFILFFPVQSSWDKELKQELIHPTTFHHLLFYFAFQRISKTFKAKRFILTFENNSWEKVAMEAFRENSPHTKIIGYQHSVVPESTLGMRYLPWEIGKKNIPDEIFTTGYETKQILQSFNPNVAVKIESLCALRYEYLYSMGEKKTALNKKILIAVDAIVEARDMIDVVLKAKDYLVENEFEVCFRFHPAMTYDFFKKIICSQDLESFARISEEPLHEEINRHDCVIYWGSTVALESSFVGNGLINFQSTFPLSHDPLYRSQFLKFTFTNAEELKLAIEDLYKLELLAVNSERAKARQYLQRYFIRPTKQHLKTLLG